MTLSLTAKGRRRDDERDILNCVVLRSSGMRLKCVDVEVKWSCRRLYPSKALEGRSVGR